MPKTDLHSTGHAHSGPHYGGSMPNALSHPAFAPLQGEHALVSVREDIQTNRDQLTAAIGITDKLIGSARAHEAEVRKAATNALQAKVAGAAPKKQDKETLRRSAFLHLPKRLRPKDARTVELTVDASGKVAKAPTGIEHRTVGGIGVTVVAGVAAAGFTFPDLGPKD